ncbi:erythromycin esterase family protein [Saccharomonospora sp.]|uniref:erythromycin esterase family protein n=1 Tax=Saccharomonospora sp. TaxID=33913 RepID=UPI002607A9B6|nr:erythromycin esterase family protein [Saccharomonospora sp.]
MLGEATHGTAEFYRWRATLTQRLITEHGFSFVAVEGDWPDCHRLHCCVTGQPGHLSDPHDILTRFSRWPRWMWANEEVTEFTRWLREFNTTHAPKPVGFHGLDVYSLWESLDAILDHVREHDPDQLDTARTAARCFEPYRHNPREYAFATTLTPTNCEDEVVALLANLRHHDNTRPGLDPTFIARQNAEIVAGAERYYRTLVRGDEQSWNVRDHHMTDTLDRLLDAYGPDAKAVVWAHNTHVGDARATDMAPAGLVNLGQLARQRHGNNVVIIGYGTHHGSVIAADRWGDPPQRITMPEARPDSIEAVLHEAWPDTDVPLELTTDGHPPWTSQERAHRAVGVVYHAHTDKLPNCVPTVLSNRYDAFLHCDATTAVHPLHPLEQEPTPTETETYPSGQ